MFMFKRAMSVIKHNSYGQEILDRLDSYLVQESPQLVYWLERLFADQQNSVTYAELREAALDGYEQQIWKWQEDYAQFVNERLVPAWISALKAGAEPLQDRFDGFILDDSNKYVKDWMRRHTAEFVTNIGEDTRAAIKAIIARGQDQGWSAQQMAYAIRPCIGLTRPDALANARYRQHVFETLIKQNPNILQEIAEKQAHEAALRYAAKQHRQRAEMIANTELAFAYNRGNYEGVRQAMAEGLMGACEKVWLTAGSERVCSHCMSLNGQRIGFEDPFNIAGKELYRGAHQVPPAHPRCRCVVQYVEYTPPARKNPRLGAGETLPHNEPMSSPVSLGKIDINDSQIVQKTIDFFEKQIVVQPVENAIVIARNGGVFRAVGELNGVDSVWELGDKLEDAIVLHNHPPGSVNEWSFGNDDLNFFIDAKLKILRGIDEKFIYELTRNADEIDEILSIAEWNEFTSRHCDVIRRARLMGIGYRRWEHD